MILATTASSKSISIHLGRLAPRGQLIVAGAGRDAPIEVNPGFERPDQGRLSVFPGRTTDFFRRELLPHECGVPIGLVSERRVHAAAPSRAMSARRSQPLGAAGDGEGVMQHKGDELCDVRRVEVWKITALVPAEEGTAAAA